MGQIDCVKANFNLCPNCHTDIQTKRMNEPSDSSQGFKLNLRTACKIHGFHSGNPHKSVDLTADFKDFMDLMKYEDLWINLRIYLRNKAKLLFQEEGKETPI